MKNIARNTLMILASTLMLNAAQASDHEGNGGLMAEMMAKKYQVQPITDSAAQARLAQVQIGGNTHQNGGLMKEMLAARYQVQPITDAAVQARLDQVKLPVDSGNGGLMTEMQAQQQELKAAENQSVEKADVRG